jgi:hypothetical protein
MFTIAKQDGYLRSLADLREVIKIIKRKPYPLPKIADMLQKLEGLMYATSIDLNVGYNHMLLTPFARGLCTIVLYYTAGHSHGTFLCIPPPAAAKVVVEQLGQADLSGQKAHT